MVLMYWCVMFLWTMAAASDGSGGHTIGGKRTKVGVSSGGVRWRE